MSTSFCMSTVAGAPQMDTLATTPPGRDVLLAGVQHVVRHAAGDGLFLAGLGQFADDRGHPHALEHGHSQQPDGTRTTHPAAEGVNVKTLFINDDVSVEDSTYTIGRRGVAGNFFVIKAVAAAAERGTDLDEVIRVGERVNSVTRSMGVALTACTPPAKSSPLFELGDGEIEIGVGIHGEPGRRRTKIKPANGIVEDSSPRSSRTCPSPTATGWRSWSMAWAAPPSASCTCCTARRTSASPSRESRWAAATSTNTAPP
ncbi:UNVERIFIED_ORG: hypothetical protein ABIB52_000241 [Arthrobacter sp. UYCu721]